MISGWSTEHATRAKEVLYRCLEELAATKAALYLVADDGSFELVAKYGFARRDVVAETVSSSQPLWDWVRRHRTAPAFANVPDDQTLLRYLESGGSSHLLTVPISAEDRMVGFIDVRDKARRESFSSADAPAATSIAGGVEALLGELGLYGIEPTEKAPEQPLTSPAASGAAGALHDSVVASLTDVVRPLAGLTEGGLLALTVTDATAARTVLLGGAPLTPEQRQALAKHQSDAIAAAGCPVPAAGEWAWSDSETTAGHPAFEAIHTAVLHAAPPTTMVLSALLPAGSRAWQSILDIAVKHTTVAQSLRDYRLAARNLARLLLEPGETSYTHLRRHSQAVSELAQRIAAAAGLSGAEEELVTIAAYLHDVGMRELDYARTYRMPRPGDSEKRLYARHPVVGARIVEGSAFPTDLGGVIRHHHERWDGTGYPDRLHGDRIPVASRIIHLAEVYDTLTSPSSYKTAIGRDAALTAVRAESGKQFDPQLVPLLEGALGG